MKSFLRIPLVIVYVGAMILASLGGLWCWLLYLGAINNWLWPHIGFLAWWIGPVIAFLTTPGILIYPAVYYLVEGHLPWEYLQIYIAAIACGLTGGLSKMLADRLA